MVAVAHAGCPKISTRPKRDNKWLSLCISAPISVSRGGFKVALEPYNRDDANLLNTVEDATEFIKEVDR